MTSYLPLELLECLFRASFTGCYSGRVGEKSWLAVVALGSASVVDELPLAAQIATGLAFGCNEAPFLFAKSNRVRIMVHSMSCTLLLYPPDMLHIRPCQLSEPLCQ